MKAPFGMKHWRLPLFPVMPVGKPVLAIVLALLWTSRIFVGMASAKEAVPAPVQLFLDALQLELRLKPHAARIVRTPDGYELRDVTYAEIREDHAVLIEAGSRRILLLGGEESDGLIRFSHVRIEDTRLLFKSGGRGQVQVRMPVAEVIEVSILPPEAARTPQERLSAARMQAQAVSIPGVLITLPSGGTLRWRDLRKTWRGNARTGEGQTEIALGRLEIPAAYVAGEDRALLRQLRTLGLERLRFSGLIRGRGQWQADQRLHVTGLLRVRLQAAGSLRMLLEDMAFPQALLRLNRTLAMNGNDTPGSASPLPRMLDDPQIAMALRGFTVRRLQLTWQDEGLTRRYLAMRGIDGSDATAIDALVSRTLSSFGPLQKTALGRMAKNALRSFLREPRNLRIDIRGRNGVPVSLPMLSVMLISPEMITGILEIGVQANTPETADASAAATTQQQP